MPLKMEVSRDGQEWKPAGVLTSGDAEGSISHNPPGGGRDVIMFRCEQGRSVISRSAAGLDYEQGDQRVVATLGTEEIAVLGPGESFGMPVTSDRGLSYTVRWTHTDA